MPAAIPLVAGFLASGYVASIGVLGTYAWVGALAGGVVAFGTTKLLGLDKIPGVDDPGIKANVQGTVAPIPIVYGKRRLGGVLAQIVTSGRTTGAPISASYGVGNVIDPADKTDNKFLNVVVCWCEGEVEGVQFLYFTDVQSNSSKFTDAFEVEHYTGTDTQTASPGLLSALATTYDAPTADLLWSADHVLRGIAYTYVKLKYDPEVWVTGIPQITAEVKGRKVLDLRDLVWKWSDNPALCIYDYLTNTRFGRGIGSSEIDSASFIDAANYCDQLVTFTVGVGGVQQARYNCDAILSPDDTALDNLKILLTTCRGALIFSGGLYKLMIDKPEVSSFDLTEDNIVGNWSIILESGESRYNKVTAQWINRSNKYQENLAILSSASYLSIDGNVTREAKIDLPATCNQYQPLQHAGIILRQSRYSLQCEVTATIEGLNIEVYDVISVTHELPGWDGQLFRVMGISLESDDLVRLQLQQYADEVYDLDSQNVEDSPPPTSLPDPRTSPAIDYWNASQAPTYSGGILVSATVTMKWACAYNYVNLDGFEFRVKKSDATEWAPTYVPYVPSTLSTSFPAYTQRIIPVEWYATYYVEVRSVNKLGIRGPVYSVTLNPGGVAPVISAPTAVHAAPSLDGIKLTWANVPAGYRVEIYSKDSELSFPLLPITGGATAVKRATVSSTYYDDSVPPPTAVYRGYWIRAVSPEGAYSPFTPALTSNAISSESVIPYCVDDAEAKVDFGLRRGDIYRDSTTSALRAVA